MLRSRRKNRDLEGITTILSEDLGEVLAESFTIRYLCGISDSGTRAGFSVAMEKLREGLQMFMTSGEVSALIRRIRAEWEGELPKERNNGFEASPEE
jgi:hypothetical protein